MLDQLQARAAELAGREVEVEETEDGKFIALFMRFEKSPPAKGETPEEALQNLITLLESEQKAAEPLEQDK